MYPKITGVEVLDDYKLSLKFDNNENRIFDVKPYLKYDEFQTISDYNEFKKVSASSETIKWASGPDLSMNTVYDQSTVKDTLGENEQ